MGVCFCRITGPSSNPSEGRKIVRPVIVSPFAIGQLMELGPRNFGSSDGWYWIVPCFGMFTNSCGANCSTKAMMPMSAPSPFIAAVASGALREANWKSSSPFSCAATFMGSGLPPSFSGAQKTPATVSPRARNASSTAFPKSCWPMIAIFMSGVLSSGLQWRLMSVEDGRDVGTKILLPNDRNLHFASSLFAVSVLSVASILFVVSLHVVVSPSAFNGFSPLVRATS